MLCPSCRGEFRPGFTHCKKCDKDLIDKLEPLPEEKPIEFEYVEMVTIADTTDLFDIALARGALESANIRFTITNEHSLNLFIPGSVPGLGNPLMSSKITVEKGKEEEARLILQAIIAEGTFNENDEDEAVIEE